MVPRDRLRLSMKNDREQHGGWAGTRSHLRGEVDSGERKNWVQITCLVIEEGQTFALENVLLFSVT